MAAESKKSAQRIASGLAIGAANGLFGGGGGMLAVPILQKTGLQEKKAHATAILLILPVAAFSFVVYALQGFYLPRICIPTAIGVTAGGILGAELLGKASAKAVNILFCILQALAGAFLFFF